MLRLKSRLNWLHYFTGALELFPRCLLCSLPPILFPRITLLRTLGDAVQKLYPGDDDRVPWEDFLSFIDKLNSFFHVKGPFSFTSQVNPHASLLFYNTPLYSIRQRVLALLNTALILHILTHLKSTPLLTNYSFEKMSRISFLSYFSFPQVSDLR